MPDLWFNWKIMRPDLNIAKRMKDECWHPSMRMSSVARMTENVNTSMCGADKLLHHKLYQVNARSYHSICTAREEIKSHSIHNWRLLKRKFHSLSFFVSLALSVCMETFASLRQLSLHFTWVKYKNSLDQLISWIKHLTLYLCALWFRFHHTSHISTHLSHKNEILCDACCVPLCPMIFILLFFFRRKWHHTVD